MIIKRILCFIISLIILFSFIACSRETSNKKPNETTDSITTEKDPNNTGDIDETEDPDPYIEPTDQGVISAASYPVKTVAKPVIPRLTWARKYTNDGHLLYVAKTPFEIDLDSVYSKYISDNEIFDIFSEITKTYNEKIIYDSETSYYQEHEQLITLKTGELFVSNKTKATEVNIYFTRDSVNYDNIHEIKIEFYYHGKLTPEVQKDLYKTAKHTFGLYTKFLVYGQDKDGLKYNGAQFESSAISPLSDTISYQDCSYLYQREIDKENQKITISIGVDRNDKLNDRNDCYRLDTKYYELPYKYEDALPGVLGHSDPTNKASLFANTLFGSVNPNYLITHVESVEINITEEKNGTKQYSIETEFYYEDTSEHDNWHTYNYIIKYSIKENEIISVNTSFLMHNIPGCNNECTIEDLFNEYVMIGEKLLPESNLSKLATCPGNGITTSSTVNTKLFGQEIEIHIIYVTALEKICVSYATNEEISEDDLLDKILGRQ